VEVREIRGECLLLHPEIIRLPLLDAGLDLFLGEVLVYGTLRKGGQLSI
jgi:hypothetical protein